MTSLLKPVSPLHQEFGRDEQLARVGETVSLSQAKLAELPVDVLRERSVLVPVELQKIAPFLVSEVPLSDHVEPFSVEPINDSTLLLFEGTEQPVTEWALDYGITPAIIIGRLERGETVADAITTPMKLGYRGQRLASQAVEEYIRVNSKRWSRERRKAMRGHRKVGQTYTHDGKTLTVQEWSELTGLKVVTIRARLYAGWDIEKVLTSRPEPTDNHSMKVTRADLAREAGIDPRTVESRVRRGWTLGQALTHGPHKGVRPGVVSNLPAFDGTGAGSTLQETPNLTFSEKA